MISEAAELYVEDGGVSHKLVYACSWSWLWLVSWGIGGGVDGMHAGND